MSSVVDMRNLSRCWAALREEAVRYVKFRGELVAEKINVGFMAYTWPGKWGHGNRWNCPGRGCLVIREGSPRQSECLNFYQRPGCWENGPQLREVLMGRKWDQVGALLVLPLEKKPWGVLPGGSRPRDGSRGARREITRPPRHILLTSVFLWFLSGPACLTSRHCD